MTLFFGGGARAGMLFAAAGFLAVAVLVSMVRIPQAFSNIDRPRSAEQATFQGDQRSEFSQKFIIGSTNDVCRDDYHGMTHSGGTTPFGAKVSSAKSRSGVNLHASDDNLTWVEALHSSTDALRNVLFGYLCASEEGLQHVSGAHLDFERCDRAEWRVYVRAACYSIVALFVMVACPHLARTVAGKSRLRMSLLPRWLELARTLGRMPTARAYSSAAVLNFVWPALKSVPST